jgi:hydrogenase expression/formation protein HypC
MCLGIPGQILEIYDDDAQLAKVNVSGVRRKVNIGLLEYDDVGTGDWVLIHVGFALSKIDEGEAEQTLVMLKGMGQAYQDEMDALRDSVIE